MFTKILMGWSDKKTVYSFYIGPHVVPGPRFSPQPPQQMDLCYNPWRSHSSTEAELSQPAGTRKCVHPWFKTKYGSEQNQKCQHLLRAQVRLIIKILMSYFKNRILVGLNRRRVGRCGFLFRVFGICEVKRWEETAAAKGAAASRGFQSGSGYTCWWHDSITGWLTVETGRKMHNR